MFTPLEIPGVFLYTPQRHADPRGHFTESFRSEHFTDIAGATEWVQDNQSFSLNRFTVRGLHVQTPPHAQAKLVRCLSGAILDVALDVRPSSPTYKRAVAIVLSPQNRRQLFVPVGFAHGFATLEPNTEVAYKTSAYYNAASEVAIRFDDPALGLNWPFTRQDATLSERDANAPPLENCPTLLSAAWP